MGALLISLVICIFGMPWLIKWLRKRGIGQFIREDGPRAHLAKRGTPTMGGILIIISALIGFMLMSVKPQAGTGFALAFVLLGCGLLGFADDYTKLRYSRSLGIKARTKIFWQLVISIALAYLATQQFGVSTKLYFFRTDSFSIELGPFYYLLVFLMIIGTTNAVNLTDGLDGLASGTGALVMTAYILIAFTQFRNHQFLYHHVRAALDIAIFSGAVMGSCIGFLWWNAPPAQIFMGDTGSMALGGALAAVAILSKTELLLLILGGLFALEALSVMIQVAVFKMTRKRVFRMAPLHHHFELKGWSEETTLIRFWIVAGFMVGIGFIFFYINYVGRI
ncbi:MAG: phospho-N-acetylmuramoyl-pentapeptide-transferase [Candidatus Solincola sediminis]|uniref:Phospho-N-acetylmuramoyl-pentapeptide-transferase n=1 Tax=Candidatus Solincola sediminis TaxID=1797199 RepID=A0A1F2WRW6_9ACTN|nr:MAG: phospho-N-acetylmuramoyl-pentapeptide-transferase [Candidatus Solincola sediminis]OFW60979.1 MAG: phospho-N-acetylmuramoyl-pentapeptide-transferase [Candidatus Solincola sediminis]